LGVANHNKIKGKQENGKCYKALDLGDEQMNPERSWSIQEPKIRNDEVKEECRSKRKKQVGFVIQN
jgi:hypothetical protein